VPRVSQTQAEETMKAKLTNRPVEQVIAAIHALDLQPIKLRVMDPELGEGWTREYTESIEHAYRNYLTMLVKHPEDAEDIVVSKDVDEFWHAHILHTMKYTEDCERVFGTYLHHNPDVGGRTQAVLDRKAVLAEKTRRLYQREFGRLQAEASNSENAAGTASAAFCGAAVRAESAAFCGAAIKGGDAAFCGAAVRVESAAFCGAAIKGGDAAFCGAAAGAENAAFCGAAIKPGDAAFCGAAVKAENAAFCGAVVKAGNAAFCGAAVRAENVADGGLLEVA
jgi:hypothetical protein